MKILYIANIRFPTEKAHGIQIMKTCEAFADLGHKVELVVPCRFNFIKKDPFEYYGAKKNFKVKKLPSLDAMFFLSGKLGFWIQAIVFAGSLFFYSFFIKSNIVYSRDELPIFFLSFFRKKNIFWESHTGRYNFIVRHLLKKCAGVVAITEGLRNFYIERSVDSSKIIVAPDAVDIIDFSKNYIQTDVRKDLELPLDKKIALYVGRLDGWKGSKTVFEASKLLPAEIKIIIIGGEEKQVARFKKEYPSIIFLGFKQYKDLAENLAVADVLLLPNTGRNEISARFTSPLKLFAYMASGKPIVASDLPSIREILNENNAMLIKPDDPKELVIGITKLLRNDYFSDKISKQALRDVKEYTWEKRVEKIINFIKFSKNNNNYESKKSFSRDACI